MFVTGGGRLLALDTASGCVKWSIAVTSRNTPTFGDLGGRKVIALSVQRADVLVVDAKTGEKVWQVSGQAEGNVGAIRGGVAIYKDKVIVPISASGVGAGRQDKFECCVGHGAVVALAAKDGSKAWEYHTMPPAEYTGKVSPTGVKQRGPSGAPIWSIPLIDEKRSRVIVTTGENTSHPGTDTSDAVIALDLDTGKEVWKFQAMAHDVWNMACAASKEASGPNCPWNIAEDRGLGRDFDFGAGALLTKGVGGKDVVLAGQKSGDTWALDAESGKLLWNVRFGSGTALGGVHWGVSTDGQRLFAAISDPIFPGAQTPRPGIFAVDIKSGKQAWGYDAKPNCEGERGQLVTNCATKYGFSAAALVVDGAVIGGTLGGEVVILDGKNGRVLNTLDTVGPKSTINGIEAKGGSIDSHAISAGAGMIFINSGYGGFNQTAGNVLIAYKRKR
jgi:polyvinyl alcohol dehydrogenase (cytochrome)